MTQFTLIDPKLVKELNALVGDMGIAFWADFQKNREPIKNGIIAFNENYGGKALDGSLNTLISIRCYKKGMFGMKADYDNIHAIPKKVITSAGFAPENPNIFVIQTNRGGNEKYCIVVTPENRPALDEMTKVLGLAQ